jgi:hypothetical protein
MRVSIVVPAILSAAILTAPGLAATNRSSPGSSNSRMNEAATDVQCAILQQQLDEVVMTRQNVGEPHEATAWPTGRNLCVNGEQAQGVVELRHELRALDARPKA